MLRCHLVAFENAPFSPLTEMKHALWQIVHRRPHTFSPEKQYDRDPLLQLDLAKLVRKKVGLRIV